MRVGPDFQGALTVNQTQVVGFPQDLVVGRPLQVVAAQLQQGNILPDQIPLQIFYDKKKWIAANNRCLTAHCLAGVRPLRIIPRLPDQVEINRLSEVEGQGEINDLQYQPGAIPRLIQQPRTLPSNQMPITAGPNTWDVTQVATIPTAWQ